MAWLEVRMGFISRIKKRLLVGQDVRLAHEDAPVIEREQADVVQAAARRSYLEALNLDPARPRVVLASTAAYRNIGDHAITLGELQFLHNYFPSYQIAEFTSPKWREMGGLDIPEAFGAVTPVFLQGGGHMGTLWGGGEEDNAMDVIAHCAASNPCVFFPQTAYYEDSEHGRERFEQRRRFYGAHENVAACLRDKVSFDLMGGPMGLGDDRVCYTPDIALFLKDPTHESRRHGVTLCFRHDEEKVANDGTLAGIEGMLASAGYGIRKTDMVPAEAYSVSAREERVNAKLQEFRDSELVITDRLHAMIFCAITHTPCIAFNNVNGKVGGVYEWIRPLSFIRVTNPSDVTDQLVSELLSIDTAGFPSTRELLSDSFDKMASFIANRTGMTLAVCP